MMYTKLSLVAKGSTVQKAAKQSHFNYTSPHCNLDFEDDNCLFHMTRWLMMMPSLVTRSSAAQEISSGQTIETLFKHLLPAIQFSQSILDFPFRYQQSAHNTLTSTHTNQSYALERSCILKTQAQSQGIKLMGMIGMVMTIWPWEFLPKVMAPLQPSMDTLVSFAITGRPSVRWSSSGQSSIMAYTFVPPPSAFLEVYLLQT